MKNFYNFPFFTFMFSLDPKFTLTRKLLDPKLILNQKSLNYGDHPLVGSTTVLDFWLGGVLKKYFDFSTQKPSILAVGY